MGVSMTILSWEQFCVAPLSYPTAATIGVFDGLHRGHQALIAHITRKAPNLVPMALTFIQNPKKVLYPALYRGDILSISQKLRLLEYYGIQVVVLVDFSQNFSKLSGKDFLDLLQDRGNLHYLAVGSNFRCGNGLDTDAPAIKGLLELKGIETQIVPSLMIGGAPVSSSRIRNEIGSGNLVEATVLLGRNVELDLSDLSQTPERGRVWFDVAAAHRIMPPPGRYTVYGVAASSSRGTVGTVICRDGKVGLPETMQCDRIEFLV
ncbi:MAG TPA: FAD synthetase family protein [Termitinemataceae bacterium]|nr:FAD synthetase family protein [Termitinemataceae bacterium]